MMRYGICGFVLFAALTAVGCTPPPASNPASQKKEAEAPAPPPSDAGRAYRLDAEPAGAKGVQAVRQDAKDGDEVVVVGRIGGSAKPFTGRAAFTIVDPVLKHCAENPDDACPTPWDYCCVSKDDLAKATVLVKVADDQGKTRPEDARAFLGLKELQTVVVRGKAKRDDAGNLTVAAAGLFVRP